MDQLFSTGSSLIEKGYVIPGLIVILIGAGFAGWKFWINYKASLPKPLTQHVVFGYISDFVNNSLGIWTGNGSLKSQLIKKCVAIYADHFKTWLKDSVACDGPWVSEDVTASFVVCMHDIEQDWILADVPRIFITRWKEYNLCNTQLVYKYIRQAGDSTVYADDRSKRLLVLTLAQFIFFGGMRDLDSINSSLNGELEAALNGTNK